LLLGLRIELVTWLAAWQTFGRMWASNLVGLLQIFLCQLRVVLLGVHVHARLLLLDGSHGDGLSRKAVLKFGHLFREANSATTVVAASTASKSMRGWR